MKYTREMLDGLQFYNGGIQNLITVSNVGIDTCKLTWCKTYTQIHHIGDVLEKLHNKQYKVAGKIYSNYEIY